MHTKIVFSGFNAFEKTPDKFTIDFDDDSLSRIYTNFNSVLYLKYENDHPKLYTLDFKDTKKFIEFKLDLQLNEQSKIHICSNMDSFWLIKNNPVTIIKFTIDEIIDKFIIDHNFDIDNCKLFSTELMVYVLDTNSNEIIYQHQNDSKFEMPKKLDIDEKIGDICCSKEHVLFLTEKTHKVYSFGIGTRGQLGHGTIDNYTEPKLIADFINVEKIATGGWHSALIDKNFSVCTWGWNMNGQLGLVSLDDDDNETIVSIPCTLDILNSETNMFVKFKRLSLGARHTVLVDDQNCVYVFGWNKYRQLFISDKQDDIFEPTLIEEYKYFVLDVKCGPWFTLLLISN